MRRDTDAVDQVGCSGNKINHRCRVVLPMVVLLGWDKSTGICDRRKQSEKCNPKRDDHHGDSSGECVVLIGNKIISIWRRCRQDTEKNTSMACGYTMQGYGAQIRDNEARFLGPMVLPLSAESDTWPSIIFCYTIESWMQHQGFKQVVRVCLNQAKNSPLPWHCWINIGGIYGRHSMLFPTLHGFSLSLTHLWHLFMRHLSYALVDSVWL